MQTVSRETRNVQYLGRYLADIGTYESLIFIFIVSRGIEKNHLQLQENQLSQHSEDCSEPAIVSKGKAISDFGSRKRSCRPPSPSFEPIEFPLQHQYTFPNQPTYYSQLVDSSAWSSQTNFNRDEVACDYPPQRRLRIDIDNYVQPINRFHHHQQQPQQQQQPQLCEPNHSIISNSSSSSSCSSSTSRQDLSTERFQECPPSWMSLEIGSLQTPQHQPQNTYSWTKVE